MNYIGIDVGDGESCVCVLPENSQIAPRPAKITGKDSFLSAVALTAEGSLAIGANAMGMNNVHDLSVRFKSRFLSNADDARRDLLRFLKGIHEEMEKEGLFQQPCEISVGCPAGWQNDARDQYLALIRKAGFDSPRIVSESRAAFLYAKYAPNIQLNPDMIEDSALVIDIGSSTLDFAYVVDGCESNVGTFGDVYLGGGAIDEAILQAAVNEASRRQDILKVFQEAPEWRSYCLLAARRLKEEYFTRQSAGDTDVHVSDMVTLYYDQPLPLTLRANDQMMWRVINLGIAALGNSSFYQMLKNALEQADEQTKGRPPKVVLLTGGASRMLFFQQLRKKQFPDALFVLCDEPELSIAKGLAYSIRVDKNIQRFNESIREYLADSHIHDAVNSRMSFLIDSVSDYMTGVGFQEARSNIEGWRSGMFNTLNSMQSAMEKDISARLNSPAVHAELLKIVENELGEVSVQLQPQLDAICKAHHVPSGIMQLNGISLNLKTMPNALPNPDLEPLQRTVQLLITGIVTVIMLAIPGIQIIPVILAAAAAIVGKNYIASFTQNANIPVYLRKMIPIDRIASSSFQEKLRGTFRDELSSVSAFREEVAGNMEKLISRYVSGMARSYEIRITGKEDMKG